MYRCWISGINQTPCIGKHSRIRSKTGNWRGQFFYKQKAHLEFLFSHYTDTIDVLHSIVQEYFQQLIIIVTWFRVTFYLDRAQIIFCMFELSGYFLSSYNFPILLDRNKLVYYWQTSIWSLRQYVQFLDCIDIMEAKTVAEYQVVACFLVNWGTVRCLFCFKISFFQHGAKSSGRILRKHQL
jgi:hypothetical protein